MVTIETPGFKPKRLLTLDMNFHVPSKMSPNHGNNYAIIITITITIITISNFAISVIFS